MIFHITFGLLKSSLKIETEDFNRPKIVYPETTQGAFFAYDDKGYLIDKTAFILQSEHASYLQSQLSSKLFEFAYKRIFSSIELGKNGYQYNKHALVKLPIIQPTAQIRDNAVSIYTDSYIYSQYDISLDEIEFINLFYSDKDSI